ncbi:MAG: single-stranded DNA-binding protein, partial [Candidatus Bathyarchaeota archaeon]|nr:single-stranded DNA-binding protein [Candidatus Bathyarchaeota archaeon]
VTNPKIEDLKAGMKKVNLKARVLEIPGPIMVYTRFGGEARISNALVADETGTVKLSLWGPQINVVTVNDVIQIENAYVSWFRGERQLRIGKHGRICVVRR